MTTTTAAEDNGWSRFDGVSLSDKQWQKIKASFEAFGVNADAVIIQILPGSEWPLREGLPRIAADCDFTSALRQGVQTPKQIIAEQSHTIELCTALLTRLNKPRSYNCLDLGLPRFHRVGNLVSRMRADLATLIAELDHGNNALTAVGTRRGKKNSTTHNEFWKELTRVWRANVGTSGKSAKHLAKFLLACSEPLFPEETTYGALSAFIERRGASSK